MSDLKISSVKIDRPEDDMSVNVIIGMSHFIKTVEDIHEALVNSVAGIKFGIAFAEASGPKLIRTSGTDADMQRLATENMKMMQTGHTFIVFLKDAFPVNVLNAIKNVPEVCRVFCATANSLEVIIAESDAGRGIMGVIDGQGTGNVEKEEDVKTRKEFLRKIGYKA